MSGCPASPGRPFVAKSVHHEGAQVAPFGGAQAGVSAAAACARPTGPLLAQDVRPGVSQCQGTSPAQLTLYAATKTLWTQLIRVFLLLETPLGHDAKTRVSRF
jgi:hypothetical protein